jgi:hypothetical protein
MNSRNLLKGTFLVLISLAFGLGSPNYSFGSLERAGPGLFPLLVSGLLFAVGVAIVVRALLTERVPLEGNVNNIAIVLTSLAGFALISEHLNMIAGIVFLVFCSGFAGSSYSIVRNVKIAAVLIAIAFAFHQLLGLQLPLY